MRLASLGNPDREKTSKIDTEKWKEHSRYYKNQENIKKKELKEQSATNLEDKILLKYNTAGEPILAINPKPMTAVYLDDDVEFDSMMQIYESAGWKEMNSGNTQPTDIEYIHNHEDTAVGIKYTIMFADKTFGIHIEKEFVDNINDVITFNTFCQTQKITPIIKFELNEWYSQNKPARGSILCRLPF